jgi:hypothetical protein
MAQADDVFQVIMYTTAEVAAGAEFPLMRTMIGAIDDAYKMVAALGTNAPAAWASGAIKTDEVEVYFVPLLTQEDVSRYIDDPSKRRGPDYMSILFFNEAAMRLFAHYQISLPVPVKQIRRDELPKHLGTMLRFPWYHA